MLERIWRSIDPQFFRQIEGLLEDTIQKATPNFIASTGYGYLCNRELWLISFFCRKVLRFMDWISALKPLACKCKDNGDVAKEIMEVKYPPLGFAYSHHFLALQRKA